MAFSQSFEFGNSTFMNLETEAKRAISDEVGELQVIQESPPHEGNMCYSILSKSRSRINRHHQHSSGRTNKAASLRKNFRRSQSDSTLPEPTKSSATSKERSENYSDFFRSDFSFSTDAKKVVQERNKKEESDLRVSQIEVAFKESFENSNHGNKQRGERHEIEESVLRVSQIESAFDESFESSEKNGISVFEAPICSEDVRELLETETHAVLIPQCGDSISKAETEGGALLDSSCFICPVRGEAASEQLAKDLAESRCELNIIKGKMSQLNEGDASLEASLSHMSPEQLKWSPVGQSERDSPIEEEYKMKETEHHVKVVESIDYSDADAQKLISAWNLPLSVIRAYEKKGVKKMFDWQIECLSNPKVLFEHCNLVYSAPTSAGKTLVSEILLLKSVLERGKKVILILPFISVVREKMFYLQDLLTAAGYRVEGFFGGYTPPGGFESIHVAICTIEKANSIVNKLMEHGKLDEIGTVVVDEVHLISDPGRGYILELLLAKVLYMSRKFGLQIQVITMSATLANVELLKRWLEAELFVTDYRPVALQEMIKIGNKVYDNKLRLLRDITQPLAGEEYAFPALGNDSDNVAQLCIETLLEGCSAIVFCPSKDWCENLAMQLASAIHSLCKSGNAWGQRLRPQINREAIEDVKKQLRDIPTGLDAAMGKTITYACAYHHAGLTTEERDIVEASYKSGALKILVATSTLSSGVNLPARRVIIRSPLFGGKQMSSLTYRQMIGRAGRTGRDTLGESILICTESNARIGRELISADLKPIASCLEMDSSTHLKRALLEVISSGVAVTKADIECFVNCTLLSVQKQMISVEQKDDDEDDAAYVNDALDFLIEYEFVRLQQNEETEEDNYVATRLGMACLASSMPPTDGLILFSELQKSRRCFVLESELHAVYLVTPYSVCYQLQDLDWLLFLDMWEKLSPAMKKVGELVGVRESFLVRAMRGQSKLDYKLVQIHKRFYTALALQELVNETPINVVAHKFKCTRGMLQSLQQMSSTFAGIVTAFCTSLQWSMLTLIVGQFKERLYFGVHRDLIDLMRLPDLSHKRARALFDAGIQNLVELANSDVFSVEKVLYNSLSFDSAKQHDNEDAYEAQQRNTIRNFFITGKAGMTVSEAAKFFVQAARQFVKYEIGVDTINWTQDKVAVGTTSESKSEQQSVELHMSCEEPHISDNKRKSSDKCEAIEKPETSSKLRRLNPAVRGPSKGDHHQVTATKEDRKRNEKSSQQTQNILETPTKGGKLPEKQAFNGHKANPTNSKSDVKNSTEKVEVVAAKAEIVKSIKTESKEETVVNIENMKSKDRTNATNKFNGQNDNSVKILRTPSAKTHAQIEATNSPPKHNHGPATKLNSSKEKPESNAQPTEILVQKDIQQKETTRSDSSKINTQQNVNLKSEDQPSTSAACRKLLLRKQIEERRKEALKRIQERRKQLESSTARESMGTPKVKTVDINVVDNKENPTDNKPKAYKSPVEPPKQTKVSATRHTKIGNVTPTNSKGNKENKKPKTPRTDTLGQRILRRSPRNHPTSNVSVNKTKSTDVDLFMENDSSMLNTGVSEALTSAEQKVKRSPNQYTDLAKLNASQEQDEIPSSQQLAETNEKSSCASQTPHTSRFMRSYHQQRTQRLASPKLIPQQKESVKNLQPITAEPPSSTSIELSDMSMENSLMKNPLLLNASHILSCSKTDTDASSFKSIEITDICGDQQLFKAAVKELLAAKRFGFSVGLQQQAGKCKPIIGANLLINQVAAGEEREKTNTKSLLYHINDSAYLEGVAFSIAENVVLYMNMQAYDDSEGGQKSKRISNETKLKYLRMLLQTPEHTLLMHEAKEQLKVLYQAIPNLATVNAKLEDPKVANWLLQPDKATYFHNMCQQFAPECIGLVNLCGSGRGYSSYGLDANSAILAKLRCSIEACVTVHILKGQIENLERIGTGQLYKFFNELEMPIQSSLCTMEITGFPVKEHKLQKLFKQMVDTMKKLENKIYELHGSRFNLGSSSAVAKVVGLHRRTNGRVSTSRQILEKIDSPISQLIIAYRKLNVTLTKNIQPLLKSLKQHRIHGQSITLTTTGRISMSEPNLQNVAKDFEVEVGGAQILISCRSAFAPMDDNRCLISSDFCQLEMRILAHLSQDAALLTVMKSERDLFVAIAARWNKIDESGVSEQLRNGTKQICYGIVYGMGMRSLAESLKCTEQEAKLVSEQFHAAYPGIRAYTEKVVKFARNKGYIETITGRRRYLDHINSDEPQMKSQAERQAINSTIQGSAADITKSAILRMEKNIAKYREKMGIDERSVQMVLHLHDELIFEVPTDKAKKIAKVLSLTMESCVKLNVPLKVKLKMGRSWGELKEVKL